MRLQVSCGHEVSVQVTKTASEMISESIIYTFSWQERAPDLLADACWVCPCCPHVTCSSWLCTASGRAQKPLQDRKDRREQVRARYAAETAEQRQERLTKRSERDRAKCSTQTADA